MHQIDSIAGSRGGGNEHEASRRVKTELMVQMDGVTENAGSDEEGETVSLTFVILGRVTHTAPAEQPRGAR